MNTEKITLSQKRSYLTPNLADYSREYRRLFSGNLSAEITLPVKNTVNAAEVALDAHLSTWRRNKIALFWEGENGEERKLTFLELARLANRFGNLLKKTGVKKGDRVFIFMLRSPELYAAFLAILKIGAIAGTLFPAFGTSALTERLTNSKAKTVIVDEHLFPRIVKIKGKLPNLKKVILVNKHLQKKLELHSDKLDAYPMKPEEPAFMLYTSATGNTPVCGIVIPHRAIVQQMLTARWVLDLHEEDTYWCTADPGWVTGVVYGILAPWALGITQVSFEGRFDPDRWYRLIEKYRVSVFYTAPTAIRMLAHEDSGNKFDLSTLRHICSVGEALSPFCIKWAMRKFKLPIHDTWWQTETGAMMIANFPSVEIKCGSMGKPVPGIQAAIVDDKGRKVEDGKEGDLVFKPGWPSMMTKIWGNDKLYKTYFLNGWYLSGDRAYKDKDGYFWFVGRSKEIIKTSGERVGPFEVESALCEHPAVAEAGVIGKPDKIRGEIIKAFLVLKKNFKQSESLKKEITVFVKQFLAGHAYPKEIEFIDKLPKNRSGKIVRRILKAKELGLPLGDTSTLVEN